MRPVLTTRLKNDLYDTTLLRMAYVIRRRVVFHDKLSRWTSA